MSKEHIMCNEGLHKTSVELIKEGEYKGGLVFEQTFPDPLLAVTTERVIIRKEDVVEMIKAINSFDSYK